MPTQQPAWLCHGRLYKEYKRNTQAEKHYQKPELLDWRDVWSTVYSYRCPLISKATNFLVAGSPQVKQALTTKTLLLYYIYYMHVAICFMPSAICHLPILMAGLDSSFHQDQSCSDYCALIRCSGLCKANIIALCNISSSRSGVTVVL